MQLTSLDPIIAIATAAGRGAVGIIRLSGAQLTPFAERLCQQQLAARVATYLPIKDLTGEVIDRGLAIYFPAPHSYTGEDVLELQIHGGPIVLQLLISHCLELAALPITEHEDEKLLPYLRLARPGEFTERAFLNGKLDLAQAEAVADLIDASTTAAAKGASRSLSGVFSQEIYILRDQLINLRMLVESTLDFPEEEIDFLQQADATGKLQKISRQLDKLKQSAKQGALLREGIKVVIAGQPNAGKSSLLNCLAGQELAIVTPIAGTTRDKVSQTIQIEGIPLHIIDTAGLRQATDEIEQIGIERAWDEIEDADVILFMHDLTRQHQEEYKAQDQLISDKLPPHLTCLHLYNKVDLADCSNVSDNKQLYISANTGVGVEHLKQRLLTIAGWQAGNEGVFLARERHLQAIYAAAQHLDIATLHLAEQGQNLDLMAEELRLAQNQLNSITGEFTADDLLGEIFSKFCIGK